MRTPVVKEVAVTPQNLLSKLTKKVKPVVKDETSIEMEVSGPFSSYEMDRKFKNKEISLSDGVGISPQEFFTFRYLIEIVYPLPKLRNYDGSSITSKKGETQSMMPGKDGKMSFCHLFKSGQKFNRIYDESDRASYGFSEQGTPFKRTPFKHILGANPSEKRNKDGFIEVADDDLHQSAKKSQNILNVNEHFVVKSWKKAFPRVPKSAQGNNNQRKVFKSYTDHKANQGIVRRGANFNEPSIVKKMTFIAEENVEDDAKSTSKTNKEEIDEEIESDDSLEFEINED